MKHKPAVIATILVVIVAGFAGGYYLGRSKPAAADVGPAFGGAEAASGFAGQSGDEENGGGRKAGKLEDLLPALEAKVAADPKNIELRLLLAQTYGELGKNDKAIAMLRPMQRENPKNMQMTVSLATALMESEKEGELKEAYDLLEGALRAKPEVAPMARLYQGEILLRLGQRDKAVAVWESHLKKMNPGDQRRELFEQRIAAARHG